MPCLHDITSEEYADYILSNYINVDEEIEAGNIVCKDQIDNFYSAMYAPIIDGVDRMRFPYANVPNLYTLMDTSSMSASGILQTLEQPFLNVRGQGTLIGLIDTGIDYRNPLFINTDNTTRIISIWDQTIKTALSGDLPFGTEYSREQINEALRSDDPLSIVPSIDENGHGTFAAATAAGNASAEMDFIGAAPESTIAMVKLKPAKEYLRELYCILESAIAFQENDIMYGIQYLLRLAYRYQMPLVIYIGLGTNYGSHEGTSPLGITLRGINQQVGIASVIPAGNETGLAHHYKGDFTQNEPYEDVEIRVGPQEAGFVVQLWAKSPEVYSVGFISPMGQVVQRIPINHQTSTTIVMVLELTEITVYYGLSEYGSGNQYIFIRIKNPTPGIWKVRVYNTFFLSGDFDMWLPVEGFITKETIFLDPNPETNITEPGNSYAAITVGAYNHYNNSIYIHSGRGNNRDAVVKPDIVAPGVNVYGPGLPIDTIPPVYLMTRQTGTSVSAAQVAGAVANLFTWGIVNRNRMDMTTATIKSMLIRGADRNPSYNYPNKEWGYGALNLYQTFLRWLD